MTTTIYKADSRGYADHGWLKACYYFSFSGYRNPERQHFGALRVINNDTVAAGAGFPAHPHDNMEIITIPLTGAIAHRDSSGGAGIIRAGDVQIMSAGSGIRHSEFNASETEAATLFQIWIYPKERNITPRYGQQTFLPEERLNRFQTVVAPDEAGALWINQDAWLSLSDLQAGRELDYPLRRPGNGVYLIVVSGSVRLGNDILEEKDAIAVTGADVFPLSAVTDAQLLLIEVPMHW
jgi:redox-sensitive bicupin YhaK (pirin superfamily)